jgi:hypothetical protein
MASSAVGADFVTRPSASLLATAAGMLAVCV